MDPSDPSKLYISNLQRDIANFRNQGSEDFEAHCETRLHMLKLYWVNHPVETVGRVEALKLLDSSIHDCFIMHIKIMF